MSFGSKFNVDGFNVESVASTPEEGSTEPVAVVLADNTFSQSCKIHGGGIPPPPCTGAYSGPVQAIGQNFVRVDGSLVVLSGISHTYGCPDCSSNRRIVNASPVLKIGGVPVALMGPVAGLHSNGPMGGPSGILKA